MFLRQEVWNARVELQADSQGDRTERAVRRDSRVVALRHRRDFAKLEDTACVGDIGLQDCCRALLQNLAEGPLGEEPLARSDGNARAAGDASASTFSGNTGSSMKRGW